MDEDITNDWEEEYDDPFEKAQQLLKDGYTRSEAFAEAGIPDPEDEEEDY